MNTCPTCGQLCESILKEKMVPTHEVEQANEMRRLKAHLEDMRTLVFDGSISEKAVREWKRPIKEIFVCHGKDRVQDVSDKMEDV